MDKNKIVITPQIGFTTHLLCFPGIVTSEYYNNTILNRPERFTVLNYICKEFPWVDDLTKRTENRRMSGIDSYEGMLSGLVRKIYGEVDLIFLHAFPDLLKEIVKYEIPNLIVVYPEVHDFERFLQIYKDEGCSETFIHTMTNNWVRFITSIKNIIDRYPEELIGIQLAEDETISDILEIESGL